MIPMINAIASHGTALPVQKISVAAMNKEKPKARPVYVFVAAAIWIIHPDIIRSHWPLLAVFIAMQVGGHLFDLKKFGRDTSYHTWTGRAFGLSLFVAATLIFWTGSAVPWLAIALIIGIISHIDALIITLTLPEWHHDVHTIANARRIRDDFRLRQRPSTTLP
jgi:CDP-diacylglycerol--glycerol-3-phosphate 3-phosphatidyltransferase